MHFVKAKCILSGQNGMNNYRGCQHGCIYCDARSLCYQMNHVFEDIEVKENALELLEASLKSAGNLPKYVFLHYPPRYKGYTCQPILDLLAQYQVRRCFYGHLHSASIGLAVEGIWDGVEYRLVSSDRLNFEPFSVILYALFSKVAAHFAKSVHKTFVLVKVK